MAGHCPDAERVLDSFHIVSWMGDALGRVRKRLWNQARREGDKKTTGTMRGLKYALLKNPDDLTDRQNTALAMLGDVDPGGPALPRLAAQGTPQDPPAPTRRTGRGRIETMDRLGVPLPHTRSHRLMREDQTPPRRHPAHHPPGLLQRQARSVQQQNQGHHPHGLRLPRHRQPHRHDQTPMQRPTDPPASTHPLTHENSRSLPFSH